MIERPDEGWYLKKVPFRFYVARTNWATKLSQLERMNANQMVIVTFSLSSDEHWLSGILEKMSNADGMQTKIICNSKFAGEAVDIYRDYDIPIWFNEDVHTKMVWFDNGIVWFGSQNMVKTANIEFLARIKDKEVSEKIKQEFLNPLFAVSEFVDDIPRRVKCPNCGERQEGPINPCRSCQWSFDST